MGALLDSCSTDFQQSVKNQQQRELKVGTLNYCGIAYSPYEFYFRDYQTQLQEISKIFRSLLPVYFPKFDEKTFKWKMGKLDKAYKKNRYSPMFYDDVGVFWKNFITRQQFENKWEQEWQKNVHLLKGQWKVQEKQQLKLYDFMMYHTLLSFVFKKQQFQELIKEPTSKYLKTIRPLHQISFLDEQTKLEKFKEGFSKANLDILFLQQYSKVLVDYIKRDRLDYHVFCDPTQDSLVLLKKSSFKTIHPLQKIQSIVKQQQQKYFKYGEHIVFIGADNYLIISVHLSSNQAKNKQQIENLKTDLSHLKRHMTEYQIILGGDINSFLEQFDDFSLYPMNPIDFTTFKKRTTTQAQFHKSQIEVKESKDKVISSLPIVKGSICFFDGSSKKDTDIIPSNIHPFDHFLVTATLNTE